MTRNICIKATRNTALALLGTLWLVPLSLCGAYTLAFLAVLEKNSLDADGGLSFSYMDMARSAFLQGTILLWVTSFTWTLVFINKLLPLRPKA